MKILSLLALLLTISAFALTTEEEAVLLNQELEYLQDSAAQKELQIATQTLAPESATENGKLEDMYFNNEDTVSSRAAGPRRRRGVD